MTSRDTIPTSQTDNIHRIVLPFKDQRSADISRKLGDDLKVQKPKPHVINQQCVVYNFVCDLCDADYVGYTSRNLHQRIDEHRLSAIGKHLKNDHQVDTIGYLTSNFTILIFDMLWIHKKKPSLNTQSDSIRAKLFV